MSDTPSGAEEDHGDIMPNVPSRDGTAIAFERFGEGPPVILVLGAFNDQSTGEPLARFLAHHLTVFNYDRRGRGESGDTTPYAVEREVEDLAALITEAGGSASVWGYSSGAFLALQAAACGLAITKLALYEPPYVVDNGQPPSPANHAAELAELVAAGRRGDVASSVTTPTLVIAGGASFPFMRVAAQALADALPNGQAYILEGQTHDIVPSVLGPVLAAFLAR